MCSSSGFKSAVMASVLVLRLAVCENFWLSLNCSHFRVLMDGSRVSKFRVGTLFWYHLERISIGDWSRSLCRGSERVMLMSHLQNAGQNYHTNRFIHCEIYLGRLVSSVSTVSMWAGILTIWGSFFSLSYHVQSDCEASTAHTGVKRWSFPWNKTART
jgi:hypothetical protein